MKKTLLVVLFFVYFLFKPSLALAQTAPVPAKWVFEPWAWRDDINENTRASLEDMVNGYISRGIPLGAVIIDSPWESSFNNFEFDPFRYPDPQGLINWLRSKGIKVNLWITSFINQWECYKPGGELIFRDASNNLITTGDVCRSLGGTWTRNPNFMTACENNYFIENCRLFSWWIGHEAGVIDPFNPAALTWWHSMMDKAFNLGIDGWKVDSVPNHLPETVSTAAGNKTRQQFADAYYRDFYQYTRTKLGSNGNSLARPVDGGMPRSPVDANPAGWLGDQCHSWDVCDGWIPGLKGAIDNMFASANARYNAFGSDIGGYYGNKPNSDKTVYLRWVELGAMSPIMENGGNGMHEPWEYDDQSINIYRYFAKLHHQLVPYLYSYANTANRTGTSIVRPQSGSYQYKLGEEIFVSAITSSATTKSVVFPSGSDWIDYWNDSVKYTGGSSTSYSVPIEKYPIFIKQGAIIPMNVSDSETGHGTAASNGKLTVLVYPFGSSRFDYYPREGKQTVILSSLGSTELNLSISNADTQGYIFRIKSESAPYWVTLDGRNIAAVSSGGFDSASEGWYYNSTKMYLWLKFNGSSANSIKVSYVSGGGPCACPSGVPGKNLGNANCDSKIDGVDFELWREELLRLRTTLTADFNCDGQMNEADFSIWMANLQ